MNLDLSALHVSSFTLLGSVAIVGFYVGRAVHFIRLPSIIGYMAVGIVFGPYFLRLLDEEGMERLSFITDMALGFVAFSIGSELSLHSLRRQGAGIVSIILCESFAAFLLVSVAVYLWTGDLPMALIFGSMAPASAPAGTVAVIHEYGAKGNLTKALYAVVGFDDGLAIIIFAFASAVANSLLIGEATGVAGSILPALTAPAGEILLSLLVGGIVGFVFCQLVRNQQRSGDIFILLFGAVFLATGLSLRWHLSLILTNMGVGFVLANLRREPVVRRISAPLLEVMPLVFVLFFFLAGAHLKLSALPALGSLGIVYILGRSAGLIGGARIGGMLGHVDEKVKKYIGLGILSQAGVAIGLALIIRQELLELGSEHAATIGVSVLTTVTATCVFFELIGPILTKIALEKAGEIPKPRPSH